MSTVLGGACVISKNWLESKDKPKHHTRSCLSKALIHAVPSLIQPYHPGSGRTCVSNKSTCMNTYFQLTPPSVAIAAAPLRRSYISQKYVFPPSIPLCLIYAFSPYHYHLLNFAAEPNE